MQVTDQMRKRLDMLAKLKPPTTESDKRVRSVRNLNPGNLRVGTLERGQGFFEGVRGVDDEGFAQFDSLESGRNALDQQVRVDTSRNLTLGQFLDKYTPASDDPEGNRAAKANLSSALNVDLNTPLSQVDSAALTRALTQQEGGKEALQFFFEDQQEQKQPLRLTNVAPTRGRSGQQEESKVEESAGKPVQATDDVKARLAQLAASKPDNPLLAQIGGIGRKFLETAGPVIGEEFSAAKEMITDLPGTARQLKAVGAGLDDVFMEKLMGEDGYTEEIAAKFGMTKDPEAAKALGYAGEEYMKGIKNWRENPARALVNIGAPLSMGLSGGASILNLLGRAPRTANLLTKAGRAVDLVDPVTGAARVAKGTVLAPFKVAAWASSPGGTLFDAGLGFTTGTSQTSMNELKKAIRAGQGDVVRSFRQDGKTGRSRLIDQYKSDYQKIQKQANEDYELGKRMMIEQGLWNKGIGEGLTEAQQKINGLEKLREMTSKRLQEFGADIRVIRFNRPSGRGLDFDVAEVVFPSGSASFSKKMEPKIRGVLNEIVNLPADLRQVDVAYLDKLRKQLRDDIDVLGMGEEAASKQTKKLLTELRTDLKGLIDEATFDPVSQTSGYDRLMGDYRIKMEALDAADNFFNIKPGDTVIVDGKDVVKGGYGRLASALNERPEELAALDQFERVALESGGSGILKSALIGTVFNPLFGSGLVVKSEVSGFARGILAFEKGLRGTTALLTLPAIAIFSPRAVGRMTQELVEAGMMFDPATKLARFTVNTFEKINKKIPMREIAREGLTIGQILERLNEDAELAQMIEDLEKGQN
tara:strand:+ start:982 stop:3429 length:2448 start_codon:yes stop_codon:yes gene_type:complete